MIKPIHKESSTHGLSTITGFTDIKHHLLILMKEIFYNGDDCISNFRITGRSFIVNIDDGELIRFCKRH